MRFISNVVRLLGAASLAAPFASCAGEAGWSTISPVSDLGRMSWDIYSDVIWWTLGILVVVEGLLLYALWRYRSRSTDSGVPDQVHGHTAVEVAWTLIPAVILFFIAIPTVRTIFETQGAPPAEDPLEIRVVGHQWWWEFEYTDLGIRTANEIHVPVGRTVNLTLTTADVIHSFWVPRLGGKRDLNPGRENTIWFTADSIGVYDGQCAELCGTSHANMRLRVIVESPDEFEAWAASYGPVEPDAEGFQTFLASGCAACHTIHGTPAQGILGPDLTRVGNRSSLAAGILENTEGNMEAWLRSPDSIKPGSLMPDLNLSEERLDELVTFLGNLR